VECPKEKPIPLIVDFLSWGTKGILSRSVNLPKVGPFGKKGERGRGKFYLRWGKQGFYFTHLKV